MATVAYEGGLSWRHAMSDGNASQQSLGTGNSLFRDRLYFSATGKSNRPFTSALTFLGIVVPASVGSAVVSFGAQSSLTGWILGLGAFVGFVQLVGSIWSLSARWEDTFAYSQESCSANYVLQIDFRSWRNGRRRMPKAGTNCCKLKMLIATMPTAGKEYRTRNCEWDFDMPYANINDCVLRVRQCPLQWFHLIVMFVATSR